MALIEPEQFDQVRIERMIFHVVGPEAANLVLLEEIEPGDHADFFLERIKSAVAGIMFDFLPDSPVLAALLQIEANPDDFAAETKKLATLFNGRHGGATSIGVFLVFALTMGPQRLYAIVKYDHEEVLSYTIREDHDVRRAIIAALESTFVRSPNALQKAAIIKLSRVGGELSIRDRVAPSKVTLYFQEFLGAKRRFEADQLTKMVAEITKKTARKHLENLDPVVVGSLNQRVYEVIQSQPGFDPENKEPFLASVFGPLPEESPVRKTFARELKNSRIQTEVFDFAPDAVPRPSKKHMVTNEGIEVIYDREYDDRVRRVDVAGGGKQIIIDTGGIRIDDDYAEPRSRVR